MNTSKIFLSAFIVASITWVGSLLFTRWYQKHQSLTFLERLVAVGSGYMLGVLFYDLIPASFSSEPEAGLNPIVRGSLIIGGMVLVIAANQFFLGHSHHDHSHCTHDHNTPEDTHDHSKDTILGDLNARVAVICLSICSFFDGITVSAGYISGEKMGVMILIGQAFHLLPEGIMAACFSLVGGGGYRAAVRSSLIIGFIFLLGSALPLIFNQHMSWFLAISTGIIVFVTIAQLLPASLKKNSGVSFVVLGILTYFLLRMGLHHHH